MFQKSKACILCLSPAGDNSSAVVAETMNTVRTRVGLHLEFIREEASDLRNYACFLCSSKANRDFLLHQKIDPTLILVINEEDGGLPRLEQDDFQKIQWLADFINSKAHTILAFIAQIRNGHQPSNLPVA